MKVLEYKLELANSNLFYTEKESEEHDNFIKKYVLPIDKSFNKKNFYDFDKFFRSYEELSENVKENLKYIYIEFKILFFKSKINTIILANTFKLDYNSFNNHVNELQKLIWNKETSEFLEIEKKDFKN